MQSAKWLRRPWTEKLYTAESQKNSLRAFMTKGCLLDILLIVATAVVLSEYRMILELDQQGAQRWAAYNKDSVSLWFM